MMTSMLWGTEYLGRQQQPGRTNLPATPQRAAGNSSEQWGGPGFTLLPDQSVAHHTIRYSSHSSESKKEKLCSDYKREQEEIKKLIEFHCRSNPELKYVVLFIKKKKKTATKKKHCGVNLHHSSGTVSHHNIQNHHWCHWHQVVQNAKVHTSPPGLHLDHIHIYNLT